MKKTIIIAVFLVLLCLFACDKTVKSPALPSEFDADIHISANGTEYDAVYEKRTDFDRLIFSTPESLCGLELTLKDGVTTVTLEDVTFESESLTAAFDFLPVTGSGEKTVGNREYRIKIKER